MLLGNKKKSIEILAVELLQIYAAREKIKGNSYKKSSDWYKVQEESFEFIETADQIKAINEKLAALLGKLDITHFCFLLLHICASGLIFAPKNHPRSPLRPPRTPKIIEKVAE